MDRIDPPSMCWEGDLKDNWESFIRRFRLYLTAVGADNKASKTKCSMLVLALGTKGIEVYDGFKMEEDKKLDLEEVIKEFQTYCTPRRNETFQRYLFYNYERPAEMNFQRYVTTLRKLAGSCGFNSSTGNIEASFIRDKIISSCQHPDLTKRLLSVEELTLDKTIQICSAYEAVAKEAPLITPSSSRSQVPPPISINPLITDEQLRLAVEAIRRQRNGRIPDRPVNNPPADNQDRQHPAGYRCSNCRSSHPPGRCPARGKKCYACGKYNHFASVCRSSRRRSVQEIHPSDP